MAISSVDDFLASLPGQLLPFLKVYPALQAAGQWYSPWLLPGIPGAGVAPASGVAGSTLTKADAGAIPFTNPTAALLYLERLYANGSVSGLLHLFDRLWHNSGLSPTVLTAQTVNSVALPSRCPVLNDPTGQTFDNLGMQAEPWFQVLGTAMGTGASAPSISYTDESGNAGNVGTVQGFVASSAVGRTYPFSLAAGDRGVRSIQTYTNAVSLVSGAFCLVLRRRIATVAVIQINAGTLLDWAASTMPAIPPDSHLEFVWLPTAVTAGTLNGDLTVIQG